MSFLFNTEHQGLASWLDRAEKCADLVRRTQAARGFSLADIGCGDQKLRVVLERRRLTVDYRGFDINPQSADVSRFDADLESLPRYFDVAAALGLIEYLQSVPAFLRRVRTSCDRLILSHVAADLSRYSAADLERLGWRNHLQTSDVENLLTDAGFRVTATTLTADRKTKLWMCE